MCAVLEFAGPHAFEQVQVLLDGSLPVRALATGFRQGAAVFADFFGRQAVDVGLALPDELDGIFVEAFEIVGRKVLAVFPVESEPAHIFLDGIDILDILFGRVGVVEPKVAQAGVVSGDAEIQADRLGVADVEIPVGLRREPGHDPAVVLARRAGPHRRSSG